jgi:alcohol dehydrogenase class IV
VIEYNFPSVPERYRSVARALGLPTEGLDQDKLLQALLGKVRSLRVAAGITRTLSCLGVTAGALAELSVKACADACLLTNPRQAGPGDIEAIYEKAL